MSLEPPPTYSPETPSAATADVEHAVAEPQILLIPPANSVSFQKGYLGAEGERAAIEGELQVKCPDGYQWDKVSISLRTVETANGSEIELGNSELVLSSAVEHAPQRSSFPFSIPLPADTPQCVHTPQSSLTHTLSAHLLRSGAGVHAISRSLLVHTRRYTSRPHELTIAPETRTLDDPTRVEVQIPRTTFVAGELLPVYVTVPVPRRELVTEQALRLRNIRAELVRSIQLKDDDAQESVEADVQIQTDSSTDDDANEGSSADPSASSPIGKRGINSSNFAQEAATSSSSDARGDVRVVSFSGASCRLHPTQPIRVRLILHPPTGSPDIPHQALPPGDYYYLESDDDCASITQNTLLHSVTFSLRVHATFMNMSNHTERTSTITIPVTIIPPTARLPEVEHDIDAAYHKKHDRPPERTVRVEDGDAPRYEGVPGPSFLANAPPPFEEREAPPPFSTTAPEASTSSGLPTFMESEREIYLPAHDDPSMPPPSLPPSDLVIEGEGTLFGFTASDRFDGYSDEADRSFTPPPSMEMASRDPDVTRLANLDGTTAMEALEFALDHQEGISHEHLPPPPPPPMDDPSDPPPSIDSAFRAPGDSQTATPQVPAPAFTQVAEETGTHLSVDSPDGHGGEAHAPPPYVVPEHVEHHNVAHPPPYVDLVPNTRDH
ncbi:hypothetical protein CERSUDRAFT_102170 [Gelatoporia subvermispora B]|uniref:Uncharacterized protein n=1 Tax=Ceriporiopsis subvermispora (strain B) TaxID=914234 RepID=M2RBE5_CERS8|nr:hypothetical protein CERSUDRAFT_102170 [Gelatoporia subvermispora B]